MLIFMGGLSVPEEREWKRSGWDRGRGGGGGGEELGRKKGGKL